MRVTDTVETSTGVTTAVTVTVTTSTTAPDSESDYDSESVPDSVSAPDSADDPESTTTSDSTAAPVTVSVGDRIMYSHPHTHPLMTSCTHSLVHTPHTPHKHTLTYTHTSSGSTI